MRTELKKHAQAGISKKTNFIQSNQPQPEPAGFVPRPTITPLASVHIARGLHARLISPKATSAEKARMAREIAGALFAAEANAVLSNRARILFLRLRTHAHTSALEGLRRNENHDRLWIDYDELETLIG